MSWIDDAIAETQRRQQAQQQQSGGSSGNAQSAINSAAAATAAASAASGAPNAFGIPTGNSSYSGIPGQTLANNIQNAMYVNGTLGGQPDDGFGGLAVGRGLGGFGSGIVGADVARSQGNAAVAAQQQATAARDSGFGAMQNRFGALGNEGARQQDQARAQQMALIKQIQDQAAGRGPSLAQAQLQQANEAGMRQAMALGYSQRGAGAAGALKNIREQQAGMTQQNAADSAMLRMQEQLQARQMLGGLLGGMRGQDIGNMQFGLGNQASLGMQQAGLSLAEKAQRDQDRLGWEQARQGQGAADYRNTWGPISTILGAVGMGGQMLGGGLEAYGQLKKG